MEISISSQLNCIAKEFEVDISIEIELQLTSQSTSNPCLSTEVEVECLALCLTDLTTETHIALCPFITIKYTFSSGIRHLVIVVIKGYEAFQTCLHIFIETFEQTESESVLYLHVLHLIVDGVIAILKSFLIIPVQIIIVWCFVGLIAVVIVVPLYGVDNAGHRHVFTFHRSINGVLNSLGTIQTVELGLVFNLNASADRICH